MFAGAAREAVFSNAEIVRRINADFIPVALKAGLVNNPPADDEGRLYRELARSMPAPQGIGVVNSAGKVLGWALMFDDDKSVGGFLDHVQKRFADFPDAKKPVAAERYQKFPSRKLDDVADSGAVLKVPDRHPDGETCPAKPLLARGTVLARVYGRALDKDGKPVADTVRQEDYVEDRFDIPVSMQEGLATAVVDAGSKRVRLGDDLTRLFIGHAYLGQLDMNPTGDAPGGRGKVKRCEFWARRVDPDLKGAIRIRIEGESEAAGGVGDGDRGDGRQWEHEVKLAWEGTIEIRQGRITRLLLLAHGNEKLKWGNQGQRLPGQADVDSLPAGHAIDLARGVRYGIVGEPLPASETTERPVGGVGGVGPVAGAPDQDRRQLMEAFGPAFMIFREKVSKELKLDDKQQKKMQARFNETVEDAQAFFKKLEGMKPEERGPEMGEYRQQAVEKLAAFLKETIEPAQLKRLRQLELQQEGSFALGRPDIGEELKLTDEQRQRLMTVMQDMQLKFEPLIREAQAAGKPQDVRPKMMKLRKDHEGLIDAMLTDEQKKQWAELLGKPFVLDD